MYKSIPILLFLLAMAIGYLGAPQISAWLIIGSFIYIIVYKIVEFFQNAKSAITVNSKMNNMPIYNSSDIGRDYIILEEIIAGDNYLPKAKVDFIKKAENLKADAIINEKFKETLISSELKTDKGVLNFSNNKSYYSSRIEKIYYYEFSGIAVKFTDKTINSDSIDSEIK